MSKRDLIFTNACELGFAGTVQIEKVYTSDPKQAISKKFTLLTQNRQFRKSLHFWPKTSNFEKVYTSDPKHAISKKFTLLARKCPNRQSSHFWPQTLQNHQKYFFKIINTYFRIINMFHVSFFIFYNYHIWHIVHILYFSYFYHFHIFIIFYIFHILVRVTLAIICFSYFIFFAHRGKPWHTQLTW